MESGVGPRAFSIPKLISPLTISYFPAARFFLHEKKESPLSTLRIHYLGYCVQSHFMLYLSEDWQQSRKKLIIISPVFFFFPRKKQTHRQWVTCTIRKVRWGSRTAIWLCDNELSAHPSTLGSSKLQPPGQTWLIASYGRNTLFSSIKKTFLSCFPFLIFIYLAVPVLCFNMWAL